MRVFGSREPDVIADGYKSPASGNFADQYGRIMGHIKAATDTVADGGACDTRKASTYDAYKCDPTEGAVALLAANEGVGQSYSAFVGRAANGDQGAVGKPPGFAFLTMGYPLSI